MMSNSAVRVIDPILTTVVQGYSDQEFVGMELFPAIPVGVSGGQVIEFGKESWSLFNTARAPGSNKKRIQFGYKGKPFALENHALEGLVPREHQRDASAVPGIDLGSSAVRGTMRSIKLALEVQQATIATTPANYSAANKVALAGATKWSADTATPLKDIEAGREAIRKQCGLYPNKAVFSAVSFNDFKNHSSVVERFKYTSGQSITAEMIAALIQVRKVVIGAAIYFDNKGNAQDVWSDDVVLGFTPDGAGSQETPSYGYTYTMEGNPAAEQPYYDKSCDSWIYPVAYERVPVIAGITAGYLIKGTH